MENVKTEFRYEAAEQNGMVEKCQTKSIAFVFVERGSKHTNAITCYCMLFQPYDYKVQAETRSHENPIHTGRERQFSVCKRSVNSII